MAKTSKENTTPPDDVIQLVSAEIAIGDNQETVVKRGTRKTLTYPEVLVLEKLHLQPGKPEAVRKVKHLGYVKRSVRQEKRRLLAKYKRSVVEEVYPGQSPAMERYIPIEGETPAPGTKCVVGDFVGMGEPEKIEPDPAPEPSAKVE